MKKITEIIKKIIEKVPEIDPVTKEIIIRITKKLLFICLIVILYNVFLITKSALDQTGAKEIFGYKAYIITTDSMKPALKTGDVIIVDPVKEYKLMVGDIITIKKAGEIVTHRIVEIKEDEPNEYITKGDNNTIEDLETAVYEQIEGKQFIRVPFLGSAIMLLKNKIYGIIIAIFVFMVSYSNIQKYRKKKMRRQKKLYYDMKK